MPDPVEDRRSPLNPQLALRVAIVGSVVLALFAVVFFRLWFLQVLSGSQYVAQASANQVRNLQLPAQRGEILASDGTPLVTSHQANTVQIVPSMMPVKVTLANIGQPARADAVVFNRLAHVLDLSTKREICKIPGQPSARLSPVACTVAQGVSVLPYGNVTIANVARNAYYYIYERQNEFRGVQVLETWQSFFPQTTLAAQTLGTVGRINSTQLKDKDYPGADSNSIVGQSGLEAEYDNYLRGTDGAEQVQVNAQGQPTGTRTTKQPTAGDNLLTSLDAQLQSVGQQSLAHSSELAGNAGGAFIAMDPQNGEIYGMGSYPSYNANDMVPPVSTKTYDQLTSTAANDPLFNRAIQSVGATGSTFKPITATAALESGAWTVDKVYDDTGTFTVGTGAAAQHRRNSGGSTYGPVALVQAFKFSVDTFFYNLGALLNPADPETHPNGGPLQTWARKFGIGRNPHIDLPGAKNGTLPDQRWREQLNQAEAECDNATGEFRYSSPSGKQTSAHMHPGWHRSPKHAPGGCGIADGTDRPWSIGDNISLAVGQGDVQVSPLQLALVYSALANGGTIVTPHLGLDVQNADGTVLQKVGPDPPQRHLNINPIYLEAIRQGLREAASSPGGTSDDVMGSFHQQVYGKTGTAQYISPTTGETDYGWYSAFVPATATTKPIEVTVWVEKGGFGDSSAAPVARQILSQWFYGKPGPYIAGTTGGL